MTFFYRQTAQILPYQNSNPSSRQFVNYDSNNTVINVTSGYTTSYLLPKITITQKSNCARYYYENTNNVYNTYIHFTFIQNIII